MPLLKIDHQELEVSKGARVLDEAIKAGLEIPHYCYHPALTVVGSCRMCMVEIEGMPKLQTSCSVQVGELPPDKKIDGKYDMVVRTKTDKVAAARQLVLEFLLLNHPLDCPVCDQAGECFLQDYSFKYGHAHSRFIEDKRVRPLEDLGSGVVINQNRCIMCTRCVRFTREITGTDELFVQHRGYNNKVSVFEGRPLKNPLAGNVADICPVGALLLKDYIHTTRVWHLSNTPTICTECTVGCNISVDASKGRIFRIVGRENDRANGHFICDYGRYAFHNYSDQPLLQPQMRNDSDWNAISWAKAYRLLADKVTELGGKDTIRALASPTFPNESNFLLGQLQSLLSEKKTLAILPVRQEEDQQFPASFTISGDKGGNLRGVQEMVKSQTVALKTLFRGEVGVLLVLDGDGRAEITPDLERLFKAARFKMVLAGNHSELTAKADLVLPVAGPFEREGTVTNEKGLVQWLEPALTIRGEARPDWQVVAELSQLLTGEASLYTCAGDVTWKINQTIPAYNQITRFKLGRQGQFVRGAR
ncbi:MAG: molybdopterin-dependent oxidoreductase [Candidatus Neomarinimicrobiota bacterium]